MDALVGPDRINVVEVPIRRTYPTNVHTGNIVGSECDYRWLSALNHHIATNLALITTFFAAGGRSLGGSKGIERECQHYGRKHLQKLPDIHDFTFDTYFQTRVYRQNERNILIHFVTVGRRRSLLFGPQISGIKPKRAIE